MRRSLATCTIISLLLLSSSLVALAADIAIGGELAQSFGYDTDSREINTVTTDYSVYLERVFGMNGRMYLSAKGGYDALDKASEIDLDEAFASAYLEDIDVTVGKQVISWGTADGINPTSTINPIGLSLTDSQIKGEPILAAQAIYYGDNFDLTGVLVPTFVPLDVSDIGSFTQGNEMIDETMGLDIPLPKNELASMEWAVRLGTYLSGYDLQVSYFRGWEDLPALVSKVTVDPATMTPSVTLEGKYRRVSVVGLATAGVLGDFGVWAEGAYVIPEKLNLETSNPLESRLALSPNEPYLQAVIGADHTLDNGIYAQAQYVYYGNGLLTMPYKADPAEEIEPGHYLSNHFSYSFDMKNAVDLISLVNLRDRTAALMPNYTYSLTQATSLKLGVATFLGSDGEFSEFPTQVSVRLRTVF